jgi:hypothetical protein
VNGGDRIERQSEPALIDLGEGFTVELVSATSLRYAEAGKTMALHRDWLVRDLESSIAPGFSLTIWQSSTARWESPHDIEDLGAPERARVLGNVLRALASRGLSAHVI